MLGKNKDVGKAATCRKLFSVTIIVAMVFGGFLGIISTDIGSRNASAATAYGFSLDTKTPANGGDIPDPASKVLREYLHIDKVDLSVSIEDLDSDGDDDRKITLTVKSADTTDNSDVDTKINGGIVIKIYYQSGAIVGYDIDGKGEVEVTVPIFNLDKVVKLTKLSDKIADVSLDVGLDLDLSVSYTGDDFTVGFMPKIGLKNVGFNGYGISFNSENYAGFEHKAGFKFAYDYSLDKWSVSAAFETKANVNIPHVWEWHWSASGSVVLWESNTETGNVFTTGGLTNSWQKDYGFSGDAPETSPGANSLNVDYKTTSVQLSTTSDSWDYVRLYPADVSKDIRVDVAGGYYELLFLGVDPAIKYTTDESVLGSVDVNSGKGTQESIVIPASSYTSYIDLGVGTNVAGLGLVRVDISYNDVAQAVDIESYGGTGRSVSITLPGIGTKTDTGNGVMFYNVPYGGYTISATEATTGYTGSASVTVDSKLEAFKVEISTTDPTSYTNEGTSYTDELTSKKDGVVVVDWHRISDRGETLYARCK
ncbi:MAG: hypothetical protein L6265_03065, partial [Thermoplasmatales archaeon]|nr:hypothetical protein [Thermoplasmatales archaeon]